MGFNADDHAVYLREDLLFFDGISLMMFAVSFICFALMIDVLFLGATGMFTLCSIVIAGPFIGLGYHRVCRFFTDRFCPNCGHPVRMDLFSCPNCGERSMGTP